MSKKLKLFDLVEIDWVDAIHNTGGWKTLKEFDFKSHLSSMNHKIVGYVVDVSRSAMTIAQTHQDGEDKTFCSVWSIPRGSVKKVRKLKNGRN